MLTIGASPSPTTMTYTYMPCAACRVHLCLGAFGCCSFSAPKVQIWRIYALSACIYISIHIRSCGRASNQLSSSSSSTLMMGYLRLSLSLSPSFPFFLRGLERLPLVCRCARSHGERAEWSAAMPSSTRTIEHKHAICVQCM